MAKPAVTAQDLAMAERLLAILGRKATPDLVRRLAVEISFLHESAVQCATVRVMRELETAKKSTSAGRSGQSEG